MGTKEPYAEMGWSQWVVPVSAASVSMGVWKDQMLFENTIEEKNPQSRILPRFPGGINGRKTIIQTSSMQLTSH